ncbi:nitrate- and nitrite sensing domain-containing protein [Marinactinospora thermotolerans]|uniref:histidine kinase n=1 Tax=Marinactinospora thermotolerans DSM 45154 TaxID=1122192 RepID=A0A1T4M5V3_9ACTN|nr:nitrate- and nitrite sensing domain-containing protein [Marinactinospora thermotolerans]SJZ62302.1 hypothetical protein SAMN02745673_00960 [Marinactinospora thermotolerans DSM 45154]
MSTRATGIGADSAHDELPEQAEHAGGDEEQSERPARWWAPRNWRVRSRLVALIVLPTAVAVLLGGLRISENVSGTLTHERIESMAALTETVVTLGNELGRERLLTAAYIADDPNPAERSPELGKQLEDQQKVVDQAVNEVRNGANELGDPGTELISNRLQAMLTNLENLSTIRDEVSETRISVLPAVTKYRQLNNTLVGFTETIAEGTDNTSLRESARTLAELSRARDQLSHESSLMLYSLMRGSMSGGIQESIEGARARYDNNLQNFQSSATIEQRKIYDDTFTGLEVSRMATMRLRVMIRTNTDQQLTGLTSGDSAAEYQEVSTESLGLMQQVESQIAADTRQQAADLKGNALNRAIFDSLVILAVIAAVIVITMLVARSMVRPLRRLREGAMRIAEQDLPEAIHRMRETNADVDDIRITPIDVASSDEIGEVARSFDEVHRVALRLAADEAALRSNVNSMFVNLSRRSQTLVERQIRLIDGLEQSEQDADRLADLFQLDHLATRMRRNNENLLVLSGQDNTRKWAQPIPLVDVLRGAISEVEQYERVNVRAPSHISVLGRPVNDVIHLVAELVENATSFSSHDTQVSVTARALDGGEVMVEVTDSGIGMSPDEIEATNQRLAEPPVIDVAVSRRMGLFVVSRLANRHGIQVRLRPAHNGGITALIVLPADLLITPVDPTPPALGGGRAGVPDTYAEATAAFASAPAPSDPAEAWQTPAGEERPLWEQDRRETLPKRPDPAQAGRAREEHPPSGQDLWNDAWKKPAEPERPAQSPQPARPEPTAQAPQPLQPERPVEPPAATPRPVEEQPLWREQPQSSPQQPLEESRPWKEQAATPQPYQVQPPATPPGQDSREGYGSTAYLSKRYGSGSSHGTVVPPAPDNNSGPLPIFDSIESNWFRRRTVRPAVTAPETGPIGLGTPPNSAGVPAGAKAEPMSAPEPPAAPSSGRPEDEWRSEADTGWKAAKSASEPVAGGLTSAGLPKRVPKANLVPGTAPQPENFKQIPTRSAERVRSRFSSFQQGVRQGRNIAGEQQSSKEK